MKAVIKNQVQNAINMSGKKELINSMVVVGKIKGELKTVVDARFYMGRASSSSVVYCSIWVHGKGIYTSGRGSAGGYGYHKESAALGDAIDNAGIELFGDQYADEKGMVYRDFPNPDYSESEYERIFNSGDYEGAKKYKWNNPKTLRKRVKENTKKKAYISGVGESAMRCALIAIAKAAGMRGKCIVV